MANVAAEKLLSDAVKERRATPNFEDVPIHTADLEKIIHAGLEAPSGYNLQPWRFVVVREKEHKQKLSQAAFGQPKVVEASAVVVACGDPQGWKDGDMEEMIRWAKRYGYGDDQAHEHARAAIQGFLGNAPSKIGGVEPSFGLWVNRQVMIALTTMMWTAETLGYDTAPMEGFEEDKVKVLLKIPERVRVVSLLGIGKRKGADKPYGGRFDPVRTVFAEQWGQKIDFDKG